jgi:hypothetical protein
MGATSVCKRLDPSVFNLRVERLRDGRYSDAYFAFSKRCPRPKTIAHP